MKSFTFLGTKNEGFSKVEEGEDKRYLSSVSRKRIYEVMQAKGNAEPGESKRRWKQKAQLLVSSRFVVLWFCGCRLFCCDARVIMRRPRLFESLQGSSRRNKKLNSSKRKGKGELNTRKGLWCFW